MNPRRSVDGVNALADNRVPDYRAAIQELEVPREVTFGPVSELAVVRVPEAPVSAAHIIAQDYLSNPDARALRAAVDVGPEGQFVRVGPGE